MEFLSVTTAMFFFINLFFHFSIYPELILSVSVSKCPSVISVIMEISELLFSTRYTLSMPSILFPSRFSYKAVSSSEHIILRIKTVLFRYLSCNLYKVIRSFSNQMSIILIQNTVSFYYQFKFTLSHTNNVFIDNYLFIL